MEQQKVWMRSDDGEVKSGQLITPSRVDGWGECDPETKRPDGLRGWLLAFGKMLGATRIFDQDRCDPTFKELERCYGLRRVGPDGVTRIGLHKLKRVGKHPCPLESMLGWKIVCGRLVEDHRLKLRTARLKVGTPSEPEWRDTTALSYCEIAAREVNQRVKQLCRVVEYDRESLDLAGLERVRFNASQIISRFGEAVADWPFNDFTLSRAEMFDRLIELELTEFFRHGGRPKKSKGANNGSGRRRTKEQMETLRAKVSQRSADGDTHQQIADALGITVSYVSRLLNQGADE